MKYNCTTKQIPHLKEDIRTLGVHLRGSKIGHYYAQSVAKNILENMLTENWNVLLDSS